MNNPITLHINEFVVPAQQYLQLENELSKIKKEYEEIKTRHETLLANNLQLNLSYDKFREENQLLKDQLRQKEQEIEALNREIEQLKEINKKLTDEKEFLIGKNNKLEDRLTKLENRNFQHKLKICAVETWKLFKLEKIFVEDEKIYKSIRHTRNSDSHFLDSKDNQPEDTNENNYRAWVFAKKILSSQNSNIKKHYIRWCNYVVDTLKQEPDVTDDFKELVLDQLEDLDIC